MSSTALLEVVEQVCSGDLSVVDVPGLQADALAVQHAIGRLSGWRDKILGEIEARGGAQDESGAMVPTCAWWREGATVSGRQAGRDVRRSDVLRELAVIGDAVTAGVLSPAQGEVLCRLHGQIPAADLLDAQPTLVEAAAGMDPEALARWVRHLIARHNEVGLEREQDAARERRYLQLRRDPDGTVRGTFRITDEDAEVVLTVLEPLARPAGAADDRTAGQRRADALVEVCAGAAAWMDLPVAGGQRPQVTYVLNAAWCAGDRPPSLTEALRRAGFGVPGERPAHPHALTELGGSGAWTGPQTRTRIEAVLCDARVSRVLLDPAGQVLRLESLNDQISLAQRKAVSARDRHCVAKGCHRPPAFCDVHHLTHREHGGATTLGNLVLLCRRHHQAWHRGRLHLHQLHVPWLETPDDERPWDGHAPPLIA